MLQKLISIFGGGQSVGRSIKKVKNSFDGATQGARKGSFHKETHNVEQSVGNDLEVLRARSAGAYLNSPMAYGAFDQWVTDEIGSSATITATSSNEDVNKTLNELWKRHKRFLDVSSHLNLLGILNQATRERRVHGEVFIRQIRRRPGSLPVPMQVQVIKSHMVPLIDRDLPNGNKIKQGIEFNGMKKVAVWIKKDQGNIHDLVRVPMRNIIHSFVQEFAGQVRGRPSFSTALLKEGEYNSYEESELNRKASQSSIVGMITKTHPEYDDDDGLGDGLGDDDPEPGAEVDSEQADDTEDIDDSFVSFGPNQLLIGQEGEGLNLNNSPDVGQNYGVFTTNNQRLVGAGAGVPMPLITGNYDGMNDRTLRQMNNNHRRKVRTEKNLTTDFLVVGKLWRWFVDAAVLAGANIPGYWENRDDYRQYRFSTEAFAYDHPVQDLNAAEKSIKLGTHSEKSFAEERGADYEQNITDKANHIALVKKICTKAGISLSEYNKGSN